MSLAVLALPTCIRNLVTGAKPGWGLSVLRGAAEWKQRSINTKTKAESGVGSRYRLKEVGNADTMEAAGPARAEAPYINWTVVYRVQYMLLNVC